MRVVVEAAKQYFSENGLCDHTICATCKQKGEWPECGLGIALAALPHTCEGNGCCARCGEQPEEEKQPEPLTMEEMARRALEYLT